MGFAKICPICQGCGRTSLGLFGEPLPQPTYTGSNSSAQGWTKCARCEGVGVVAKTDGGRFANGMSIDEYLQNRLRDM